MLGKDVSIVDVSCFPYAASAYWACIDVSDMPQLKEQITRKLNSLDPRFSLGVRLHEPTVQTVGILNVLNGWVCWVWGLAVFPVIGMAEITARPLAAFR